MRYRFAILGVAAIIAVGHASGEAAPGATADAAAQVFGDHTVNFAAPYSEPQPISCYWAQDRQRVRCGARVVDANDQTTENYLQIYVANDTAEFERDRAAITTTVQKQPGAAMSQEGSAAWSDKKTGKKADLQQFCSEGIGPPRGFAFCAVRIGDHVVVEAQVSPKSGQPQDDIDRASTLALSGTVYVTNNFPAALATANVGAAGGSP